MTNGKTMPAAVAAAFVFAFSPVSLPAQEQLPPAAEIIDRYVEAIGGRNAVLGHTGSHSTATFSMPMAGIEADMDVLSSTEPIRSITIIEIPGIGTIQEGYTGEYAWSMDPNMGPRLLEGRELEAAREGAMIGAGLRDPSLFTERTTAGRTEMNNEACYRVKLVWKSGRETHDCYSVETGLLVAVEATQPTPMGDIPVVSLMGEYTEFGDVLSPTRVVQQMMGQEQVITIHTVEYGEIDEEGFAPPAAIQTLIEQKESGG